MTEAAGEEMKERRVENDTNEDAGVRLLNLVTCLSDAMDFIDPAVVSHHRQVAFIAYSIGTELGLPLPALKDILLAGALHDIGAFSLKERLDTLTFEMDDPHLHAERGYALLGLFEPIAGIAPIVRFHHLPWDHGRGARARGQEVPTGSHILHLADRAAVLLDRNREVLGQVRDVCEKIREGEGALFAPQLVDAFMGIAAREYFWLDAVAPASSSVFSEQLRDAAIGLTSEDMMGFSRLFSRIIDFKSPFTATHSSGVATSAEMLAERVGFSRDDCRSMKIAGYLHDLGKLAVPVEILDKPAKLEKSEFNVVRHHSFYTYRILEAIPSLKIINRWASFHHERLDGSGYPFHLREKDLPLGSQVMCVADVFSAITEDRPYRVGMTMKGAVKVLDDMVGSSALNGEIVAVLKSDYEAIDAARKSAQAAATKEYRSLAEKTCPAK